MSMEAFWIALGPILAGVAALATVLLKRENRAQHGDVHQALTAHVESTAKQFSEVRSEIADGRADIRQVREDIHQGREEIRDLRDLIVTKIEDR